MLKQKQLMVAIAVIILLLLGVGGYFLFSKNQLPSQNQTSNTTSGQENGSAMNSLVDLLAGGGNVTCNFDVPSDENGNSSKGTVYISNGNMRGDFQTTQDGKVTSMSMIRKGNDNYVWGDGMETGMKMTLSPEDLKGKTNEASKYVDLNKKVDYRCNPWGVDSSKFNPPSNIRFTDFSKMMEETTKMMKEKGTSPDSSVCDSITDASAKAACKNALSQ